MQQLTARAAGADGPIVVKIIETVVRAPRMVPWKIFVAFGKAVEELKVIHLIVCNSLKWREGTVLASKKMRRAGLKCVGEVSA
jgi:hypothetical protein